MLPRVAKNIELAFRVLSNSEPEFSDDFVRCAGTDRIPVFAVHGKLTFRPMLYRSYTGTACAQSDYFGFYVLQQAIRRTLLAVNHQVAGDILNGHQLHGPAIVSHYTAAFHAAHACLALEGHVFLGDRDIALFTKRNIWKFEKRTRGHRCRWREFRQAFVARDAELPKCFHELFDYMYWGNSGFNPYFDFLRRALNPDRYRLRDHFEEFLDQIAETRHLSMYQSFGSESRVVADLWNGDSTSTRGMDEQALQFAAFSTSLMRHVAYDILDLAERVTINPKVRNSLGASVHMPWFDTARIEAIRDSSLQDAVARIDNWITADIGHVTQRCGEVATGG